MSPKCIEQGRSPGANAPHVDQTEIVGIVPWWLGWKYSPRQGTRLAWDVIGSTEGLSLN